MPRNDRAPDRAASASLPRLLALGGLAVAEAASAMLVIHHLGGGLPGCGPESACDSLARTVWGKVPGLGWPTAHLGLAFFSALLTGFLLAGGALVGLLRPVAFAGGAVSLLLLGVMAVEQKLCPYCLAAHLGNLAFLAAVFLGARRSRGGADSGAREKGQTSAGGARGAATAANAGLAFGSVSPRRGLLGFGLSFAVLTAVLAFAEVRTQAARDAAAEADRAASVEQMTAEGRGGSGAGSAGSGAVGTTTEGASGNASSGTGGADGASGTGAANDANGAGDPGMSAAGPSGTTLAASAGASDPSRFGDLGFRGRYLHGPEKASIRIVMLTDYQCPDCKQVEGQVRAVLEARKDVQLSIKHFPMCREAGAGEICNPYLQKTLHKNACWAARAAEAAGMVGGDEAFFDMHFWLFDKGGSFTREELDAQLGTFGLDAGKFYAAMEGAESLARVRADIEDGYALGLHFTPMVFINGVELKGWQAPTAVRRTIDELAAANLPPKDAGSDVPGFARDKFIGDWADSPQQNLPGNREPRVFGNRQAKAGDPHVTVVVWGDYQEENSAAVDQAIRAYLSGRSDIEYQFRHYPVDPACNTTLPPNVPQTSIHPRACWAAQVAEAAAKVGGESAFQHAHVWLMENWNRLDSATVAEVAEAAELRANQLEAAMSGPEIDGAVMEDAEAATQLGVRSIPLVYVDGRRVPRVRHGDETVISWILDRATSGRTR